VTQLSHDSASTGNADRQADLERLAALAQHQLNNPLAAMLAELQLLQMEPTLATDHRAAVERLTVLLRRVIALVHDLDKRIVKERVG